MPFKAQPIHILIAPNAFKNSLSATAAAAALKKGLQQSVLHCTITCCPVADGGDGTAQILATHLKAKQVRYKTTDPLGRKITAPVYFTADKKTAIIELADASGLRLLKPSEYDPLHANTAGTGTLLQAALNKKVATILLAIGGSATVDAGAGLLQTLGAKFLNREGSVISNLPSGLKDLWSIDLSALDPRLKSTEIVVLCDVKNKLSGTRGAARAFGPQKGASGADITLLEQCLRKFDRVTGGGMQALVGSGAAGGVGASLSVICGATMVNGTDYFLQLINFDLRVAKANLVITGEGAIDQQTLQGKAPFGVALKARKAGAYVIGVAGAVDPADRKISSVFDTVININSPGTPLGKALVRTEKNLVKTGKMIGKSLIKTHKQALQNKSTTPTPP